MSARAGDHASSAMRSPRTYCVAAPSDARRRTRNGVAVVPRKATRAATNVPSAAAVMLLTDVMPFVTDGACARAAPMKRRRPGAEALDGEDAIPGGRPLRQWNDEAALRLRVARAGPQHRGHAVRAHRPDVAAEREGVAHRRRVRPRGRRGPRERRHAREPDVAAIDRAEKKDRAR